MALLLSSHPHLWLFLGHSLAENTGVLTAPLQLLGSIPHHERQAEGPGWFLSSTEHLAPEAAVSRIKTCVIVPIPQHQSYDLGILFYLVFYLPGDGE